ncbi:MAG: AtpZ/AtpI family protein [Anaerolineae bacterium]|nr:AtpZ/AtpI family protein [Anaerolineae bacterium]
MSDDRALLNRSRNRPRNLAYAALAGQAGLATVVLVFAALFAGLWLDSLLGLRGPFTIGLVVLSVPLSLFMMVRIALGAVGAIPAPGEDPASTTAKEE